LWAEFGKEAPYGSKFSSKDSVKILAVGSTPSFGSGLFVLTKGSFREYVMMWPGHREGMN
jgi:hypothetical protein